MGAITGRTAVTFRADALEHCRVSLPFWYINARLNDRPSGIEGPKTDRMWSTGSGRLRLRLACAYGDEKFHQHVVDLPCARLDDTTCVLNQLRCFTPIALEA